jgi:hypothetical protein
MYRGMVFRAGSTTAEMISVRHQDCTFNYQADTAKLNHRFLTECT